MAKHPFRFTVEKADKRGEDVLVYEGTVPKVGKVKIVTDGTTVSLVYDDSKAEDPSGVAPVVLASAPDPGPDVQLRLRRLPLNRQKPGKPIIKDFKRDR